MRIPLAVLVLILPVLALAQADDAWLAGPGVSVKRPGGKIVVWAMPEAQAKFGLGGLKTIVTEADALLSALGVSTRLVVYTGKKLSRETADAMGKLVVLGDKKNSLLLARANGLVTQADADWLEKQWTPEGRNPEKSDFNSGGKGQYTFIGSEASYAFAKTAAGAVTPAQAAALFAIHGVGHQAGLSHPAEQNFNDDGARILSMLTGQMFVSDGVGVQLKKRPLKDLFIAQKFTDGCYRSDFCDHKQREKWDAAFKP